MTPSDKEIIRNILLSTLNAHDFPKLLLIGNALKMRLINVISSVDDRIKNMIKVDININQGILITIFAHDQVCAIYHKYTPLAKFEELYYEYGHIKSCSYIKDDSEWPTTP